MMRSRRLYAQKKALFWLGSSWRKKILPKPVNDAIWKRANDVLSCEEHERQISSDTSPFEQNIKVPDGCRVRMGGLWLVELFPSSLSDDLLNEQHRLSSQLRTHASTAAIIQMDNGMAQRIGDI